MADFKLAYRQTMGLEGLYADDVDDPGRETWKGISRRYNSKWDGWKIIDELRSHPDFPEILQRHEGLEERVQSFYKRYYWDRLQGDKIPSQGIANKLFNFAVHTGVYRTTTALQQVLNAFNYNPDMKKPIYPDLKEDGIFGPKTLNALTAFLDLGHLSRFVNFVKAINCLQGAFYVTQAKQRRKSRKYTNGWMNRVVL